MKKLLLTLFAGIMCFGAAFADADFDVKNIPALNGGAATVSPLPTTPIVWGDFSFTVLKNGGSTAPAYNKAGDLRLYAKNTLQVKAKTNMTKIVFTISTQGLKRLCPITASTGTIKTQASGDTTVEWTGDASDVTFTVGDKADFGTDGASAGGQFDFDHVAITGGGEVGGTTTVTPDPTEAVTGLNESFASIPATWTNTKVSGDKEWYATAFSGTTYAAMTGYKGTQPPFDAWLISPAVDIAKASDKKLSFKTEVNGYGSTTSVFEVYVLTSNDPNTATKTKLNPTLPTAPESGYSEWTESGDLDLSSYSGEIFIGFRFYATEDASYATWCLTDVKLNADGVVIEPVTTATYTKADAIVSGNEYVFVVDMDGAMKLGAPIPESATYGRLTLADVTVANNSVEAPLANAITFTAEGTSYTMKDSYGRYLGFDGNYPTSFQLYNEVNDNTKWNVAFEDGKVRMTLTSAEKEGMVGVTKGTNGTWYTNVAPSVGATEYLLPYLYGKAAGSVAEIAADEDAPVEYFNLQGVRVANPENGLYIRRQGNKVSKVYIR